jgi:hypothetical protein
MLCPNCGTKTTNEHKFCRNCGMNLVTVSRALAAHLSPGGAASASAARAAGRRVMRQRMRGLAAGVVTILFGLLLLSLLPGRGFQILGVAASLIGLVTAIMCIISPMRTAYNAAGGYAPPAPDNAAPPTGRLLHEETFEPVPSVTERTTDLLGVEVKDLKSRRDASK